MNYNAENGAFAILDVQLKAADDVVVVKDKSLLPTEFPFKMKIKKLNSQNKIIQQEIVEVTGAIGNNLNITRAAERIPYSEIDQSFTQSALDFDGGDIMELVFTAQDGKNFANEITSLENRKIERVNTIGIFLDYIFTGTETNNTQFNVDTTSGNITLDLDLSLFPTTNGLYQFTIVKESADSNSVILDLGTATIDGNTTYQLTGLNESVTFVIESDTKAKIIGTSNAPATTDIEGQTQVNSINLSDKLIISRQGEGNKSIEYGDIQDIIKEFTYGEVLLDRDLVRFGFPNLDVSISGSISDNGGTLGLGVSTSNWFVGQSAEFGGNINSIRVRLDRYGSPSGTIFLRIRDGINGNILSTSPTSFSAGSISGASGYYTFDFPGLTLPINTYYIEIFHTITNGNFSNFIAVVHDTASPYTDGMAYRIDNSGNWNIVGINYDINLLITTTIEDSAKVYKSSSLVRSIGFTKSAGIVDDVQNIAIGGLLDGFTGLNVGDLYFADNNGLISTTGTYKIGRAVSSTEILIDTQN